MQERRMMSWYRMSAAAVSMFGVLLHVWMCVDIARMARECTFDATEERKFTLSPGCADTPSAWMVRAHTCLSTSRARGPGRVSHTIRYKMTSGWLREYASIRTQHHAELRGVRRGALI